MSETPKTGAMTSALNPATRDSFSQVLRLIEAARKQAYQAVNSSLIELYWQLGAYISQKLEAAE